jgi:hypothetical protein
MQNDFLATGIMSLRHARDRVLREVFTMDNCIQTALLQQV